MSNYLGQPQVVYVERPSNTLGTAAFVLSIVGVFTAGLFSPIALVLAVVAMQKLPKDLAVSGLIISLVTLPLGLLTWLLFIIPAMIAAGIVTSAAVGVATGPTVVASSAAKSDTGEVLKGSIDVLSPRFFKAKTGGSYTVAMKIKNTGQLAVVRVALKFEMVDSNGEVLATDTFKAAMPTRLAPGETRPFEIDMPGYSPLNANMPSTAKPRVTVLDVQTE